MPAIPNPVIPGFHPDPSVCRVGDQYFLACSSFEYFPGVPVFRSSDLRAWEQLGNALDRPSQLKLATAPSSGGVYAPTLRHHRDRFWLATTNSWDRGHLIVTAEDPAGPWSDPVIVELPGVDPDLAWDTDGTCWFTYSVFGDGILQAPIDPYTGKVLADPRRVWSGTGLAYPEAPHLYRIGDQWFLLIAEGGTERGHGVSVARGPAPGGPFEAYPGNPVLSHRSTSRPVQNTGHADLVQAADGSWWMVLLGVRPLGASPAFHVLGRETFLTPVRWVDGWPVPEPVAPDPAPVAFGTRDDFDHPTLAPAWLSIRRASTEAGSLTARRGWLTLFATGDSLDGSRPAFVGRRQQHAACRVRARVDAGAGRGGVVVRLDERHHFEIETNGEEAWCHARIGPLAQRLGSGRVDRGPVVLYVEVEPAPASFGTIGVPPDRIRFGFEPDRGGDRTCLAELDGRYLSTEVAGGFTGRVIGMYAASGTVAFDWYEYAST
ncbi:glycoside hydrolase family 43 protein [Planosporangium mesophilum]|nr:glycoside hydrolase family 43 protein [Planosporangium mesophilum]NJC85503.1 glycoside hydrolase family 43 protein [Planosporangium mesophilum]